MDACASSSRRSRWIRCLPACRSTSAALRCAFRTTARAFPLEIRDRLFDPFFTTKPGGSGLGLSIVHRAIEAHAGFVFVDSDDSGTRVTVLLPSHQSETGELV